jgi:hypothetical protein
MRTAEEWKQGYKQMLPDNYGLTQELIEEIQLDAMKEGMRRAAEEAVYALYEKVTSGEMRQAILTVSEQLTIKDLQQ